MEQITIIRTPSNKYRIEDIDMRYYPIIDSRYSLITWEAKTLSLAILSVKRCRPAYNYNEAPIIYKDLLTESRKTRRTR